MKNLKSLISQFTLVFCLIVFTFSSSLSSEIIDKVKENFKKINDFQADMNLKIDISYLNAPEKSGKIFFKQPNKTKIDIDGFSMLPKQGTGNFINEILSKDITIIENGTESLGNKKTTKVKIIPNNPSEDIAIASMWIDNKDFNVLKSEIITKKSGSYTVSIDYLQINNISLPEKVNIKFSVPEFSLPKTMTGDFKDDKSKSKSKSKDGKTEGLVEIKYSNYILNKGINDSVFNK